MFGSNLVSVVLKAISVTGTNATSVFIDLLNDVGDVVGLGLLATSLRYAHSRRSIIYPFGTKRALYLFGLLAMMIFSGLLLALAAFKVVSLLMEPREIYVAPYSTYAFSTALLFNTASLAFIVQARSKSNDPIISSGTLDAVSDVAGSVLALLTLLTKLVIVDVVGSLATSIVILISATTLGYRYFHVLVGRAPPKEALKRAIDKVLEFKDVKDVNVFNAVMITEDEYMLILEVEVDKDMEVEDIEKLSARIEEEIKRVEPRFKHVIIEFVSEKPQPKSYKEIVEEINNIKEE